MTAAAPTSNPPGKGSPKKSRRSKLCEALEADIRRRGLRSGDTYLTASEAAELLGVSRATAHRAFQVLASKGILSSKQRAGTVVGPNFRPWYDTPAQPEEQIRILLVQQRIREGRFFEDLLRSLHETLPGREVTISYVPDKGAFEFVQEILDQSPERKTGYLVLGCPRSVHELIADLELPVVVMGPTYFTASDLPSVSANNKQRGQLLAQHLLDQKHSRIALLMPETWLPGDIEVYEGVNEALSRNQVAHGALVLSNTPQEKKALTAEIERLFQSDSPPTGIICKQRSVGIVEEALAQLPNGIGKEVEILIEITDIRADLQGLYTHTTCQANLQERATRASEMLKTLLEGGELEERHIKFPVELARAAT
tara:strand:+ start:282 stop:1388 length:1107 start_codon:yes stop_codon:yes gene_type:complete